MSNPRILRYDDPLALELTAALKQGDADRLSAAQWLLTRGADLNWRAPWSGQTPLEITERSGHSDIAAWLTGNGAIRQDRAPDRAG
jgi:ankyrin repeat protein